MRRSEVGTVDIQYLMNFGFAAIVAMYVLVRLEPTIRQLSRQIHLNTIVLARISGQDPAEVEKLLANGKDAV